MKLVINYQLRNLFLQDDKFSLPNRNTLFSHLTQAKWFSKFDLKYEFWQWDISIKPAQNWFLHTQSSFSLESYALRIKDSPFTVPKGYDQDFSAYTPLRSYLH